LFFFFVGPLGNFSADALAFFSVQFMYDLGIQSVSWVIVLNHIILCV